MTAESEAPGRLLRFDRPARLVHRSTAVLMAVCLATAAALYVPELSIIAGHRYVIEQLHVLSGYALPVPIFAGFCSRSYRSDVRRLNRFTSADWRWLRNRRSLRNLRGLRNRRSLRDSDEDLAAVGKFNAGQKLNAALSAGAILVLFGTGTLMYFTHLSRFAWRTGSTFVHDWTALALGLLVIGHVSHAARDPMARVGMRTGYVSVGWARARHGAWAEQSPVDPAAD